MSSKVKKIIEKVFIYVLVSMFMIFGFKWWLSGFDGKVKGEMNILSEIKDMENKTLDDMESMWGSPSDVHKEKVFTYKDKRGTYDFLIKQNVKSVVVNLKPSYQTADLEGILMEMGLKVSTELFNEGIVIEGKRHIKSYDVGDIKEFEMIKNESTGKVEKIKITY